MNLALILVVATFVTGLVWALDRLWWARLRTEAADEPTVVEWCRAFFPVLLIVLVLRSFIAEPFRIPSASMMPTLVVGDFILVNKFAYGLRLPVLETKILDVGE
ncbi:S26 family signal peptidase, partial [Amycolatopsis minnesotensis]|uniref:S26 family signal peptidase n=1 Tax=Amycolatopsis minnesotensis TaxID=337894 RepID=UPI0031D4A258